MKTPTQITTGTKKSMAASRKAMNGKSSKPGYMKVTPMGHEKRHSAHMKHLAGQASKMSLAC
jgi:hypothetical protein